MRFPCPICGARDVREFSYAGVALARPSEEASADEWDSYVHLRENPAGVTRDMWQHSSGCGAWLVITRDTATHEVISAELAGNRS